MNEILVVGNPNTGKSTLFNTITKGNRHTGNWHGVTVDEGKKTFLAGEEKFTLVDLPGIYSLSPNSFEEKVSVDYIISNPNAKIILLCANNTLKRNLLLFEELKMLGSGMILVINKVDKNCRINAKSLEKMLGVEVVEIDAKNKKSTQILLEKIKNNCFKNPEFNFENSKIKNLKKNLKKDFKKQTNFFCHKALCGDEYYKNILEINPKNDTKYLEESIKNEYKNVENYLKVSLYQNTNVVGKSKLDKILLNKYLCIPIFLLIMGAVFYITFFSLGKAASDILRLFVVDRFGGYVCGLIQTATHSQILVELFKVGIFGGVGTVISFLPQVVLLFVFLAILEDSGYISRLAFCLDDTLKKVGLSGKSVYTLLMGFGCSTTACLTARNMSDKNAKIKTAMLAPFMSCSAKLPVYAVIGGAFFGASNIFIIMLLYVLGIVLALLLSYLFEKGSLKSENQTFIMEFPAYRFVGIRRLFKVTLESSKNFLVRIGSTLLALSIIVWGFENFAFDFSYVKISGKESVISCLGRVIAPIFLPLGFSSWGTSSALLAGLVAKEMIVSSIAIFNNISSKSENFMSEVSSSIKNPNAAVFLTPGGALSFMVFCLLYSPCISTMMVLKKEIGAKWTFVSILMQFIIAYACSLVCNFGWLLYQNFGWAAVIWAVLASFLTTWLFLKLFKRKKVKFCAYCQNCKYDCNNK